MGGWLPAPWLPSHEALDEGWSSSSSEESPEYATKPDLSLFTGGSAGRRRATTRDTSSATWRREEKTTTDFKSGELIISNTFWRNNRQVNVYVGRAEDGGTPSVRVAGRHQRTPNQRPASPQRHMEEKKNTEKKRRTQKQERFLLARREEKLQTVQTDDVIRMQRYSCIIVLNK